MIQSNWCSGTARKFIIKGLAHQIPPDLSVRPITTANNSNAQADFPEKVLCL